MKANTAQELHIDLVAAAIKQIKADKVAPGLKEKFYKDSANPAGK